MPLIVQVPRCCSGSSSSFYALIYTCMMSLLVLLVLLYDQWRCCFFYSLIFQRKSIGCSYCCTDATINRDWCWYIMLMSMIVVTNHSVITCYYDFIMLWMMLLAMIFSSIHHRLNGVNLVSYRRSNLAVVVYIGSKFESTPVISMYSMLMLG
jgi:hypothetical protein